MNRVFLLFLLSIFILESCKWDNGISRKMVSETYLASSEIRDVLIGEVPINLEESIVHWKGTKLLGVGSHSGIVRLEKGHLTFDNGRLTGGHFTVDMTSINNTDIPLDDPVPGSNLTAHLNGDFETNRFPRAEFEIKSVIPAQEGMLKMTGDLTIKGITNRIEMVVEELIRKRRYLTPFYINRHDWRIGENGSWLEQKLVDKNILLSVEIALGKKR